MTTPGSMLMDVNCLTCSGMECTSMMRLWIRICKEERNTGVSQGSWGNNVEYCLMEMGLSCPKEAPSNVNGFQGVL